MRYYSDKLYDASKKDKSVKYIFDSEKELNEAETKFDKQVQDRKDKQAVIAAERKKDAENIKELRKTMEAAQKDYVEACRSFMKKYGYWHESYTVSVPCSPGSIFDLFDSIFADFLLR